MSWRVYNQVHKVPIVWEFGELRLKGLDFAFVSPAITIAIIVFFMNREHLSMWWAAPLATATTVWTLWSISVVAQHGKSSPQAGVVQWLRVRRRARKPKTHNWELS